jgi:peptidyl-prolyl cis-trans isomerase C
MKRALTGASIVAALLTLSACEKQKAEPQSTGPAVATVGTTRITVDQFKEKLAELPPMVRPRYAPPERRKEFLDNLVRNEVLLAEARSRGLEKDPEVRTALDRVLIQRLLKVESDALEKKNAPTEEEIKAFYEGHKNEFVRPERIRVSHVFYETKTPGAARERTKAEATKALADVKSKESGATKTAFGALAKARSNDDKTKGIEGDLGSHTREELVGLWGQVFADAASALKSPNEIGDVVATDNGFHLIKLMSRQPGFEQSLETAKSRIQGRLLMEKRSKLMDEFVSELKRKANVTINEDVLKSIEIAPNQPSPNQPAPMPPAPPAPAVPGAAAPTGPSSPPAAPAANPASQPGH